MSETAGGELVFLLEERSAQDLLEGLLPRVLPAQWHPRFIVFEGKQDLEKRMGRVLRAWRTPGSRFVVLRDQDAGNCKAVKKALTARCAEARRPDALVRVACRELEAWVVGDLAAFAEEFSSAQASKSVNKGKFVNPDQLSNPVAELRTFYPQYQKRDGARRMGLRLNPSTNGSPSFQAFCDGLRRLTSAN